uniref:Splicing factor YJU2 n=1 Tax=Chlorocebus sabaeus TaxID=60711 RepID=A0A0D9RE40_CHLSB
MSERKVLNKYYPPDFDPSKIPKLKLPKDRQYVVRLMAPFNMRCKTCGEYIYKGKKFNARKETVQNEVYLGLPIFRFYIKCTRCLAEITFKVDEMASQHTSDQGRPRGSLLRSSPCRESHPAPAQGEGSHLHPLKVLENRTKDSKLEMEVLENLQELKDLNQRQAHVDFEAMLRQHRLSEEERRRQEQEEDEQETAFILEKLILTIQAHAPWLLSHPDGCSPAYWSPCSSPSPHSELREAPKPKRKVEVWEQSVGSLGSRPPLSRLVVVKKAKADLDCSNGQPQAAPAPGAPQSRKEADPAPPTPGASSLSQLGAYLDSDDSNGSN